jgi:hypothetical protein
MSRPICRWLGLALLGLVASAEGAEQRLEVGWISRDPVLSPPGRLGAPREEGWPEAGSRVQWLAHVLNRGNQTAAAVPYTWRVDGETAASGVVDVPPGETIVPLAWRWSFDRNLISFEILPPPQIADATLDDDRLTIVSDALSLGLWIQQGVYDWMAEGGRPGFERWIQREIDRWNQILARAVYPTAPQGALDRIRLEKVVVLPDGQIYRNEELVTDLHWFFATAGSDSRFLTKDAPPSTLADETIVLHELLHGRGLVDLYAYDVIHGAGQSAGGSGREDGSVGILENGKPIVGTPLMPALVSGPLGTIVFRSPFNGLMGSQYRSTANLTEHCANGLNLVAGRRTPLWLDQWGNLLNGYSNVPQPDSYVNRLSRRTDVLLVDESGAPIPGATVDVYMDHSPWTYQKVYTPGPDRTYASDARGVVALPGDLLDNLPPMGSPPKSQVLILGVKTSRARGYVFVPLYDLNLVYFRQGPERGDMTVKVKLHPW